MADDEQKGGDGSMADVIFITLVLLFLIASWFLSGAAKNADVKSIFLSPPPPLGVGESIGLPMVDYGDSGSRAESDAITGEIGAVKRELENVTGLPASSYAGKVEIVTQVDGAADSPAGEYVTIRADSANTERVIISDWSVMSAVNKRTARIGKGTELYMPGQSGGQDAIALNPGDTAILATARSPIGYSFRLNRCSGYLDQFQNFTPRLSYDCPYPDREADTSAISNDNTCMDYVERMSQCRIDAAPPATLSSQCRAFIQNRLTYQGCVAAHRNDSTFASDEWRVYLGYSEDLWRDQREVLVLLDSAGKVVDTYSY